VKFIIPFVIAACIAVLSACTAQQLRPVKRAAQATTQVANDPVLKATSPATSEILRAVGEGVLAVVTVLQTASASKHKKRNKRIANAIALVHDTGPAPAVDAIRRELKG
jgi:hypothetical protein